MAAIPKRAAPPVVRTRGAFRMEYEETLAAGAEAAALSAANAELDATRAHLRALRARRVDLVRRTAEHVRKLHDWKGKVPRPLGAPVPAGAPAGAPTGMPYTPVAYVKERDAREMQGGLLSLVFLKPFVRALEGLERFDKAWVLGQPAAAGGNGSAGVHGGDEGAGVVRSWCNADFVMVLVDELERRGRSAQNKEVVVVRDGGGDALHELLGVAVIDVKPYLSYCEAHEEETEKAEAETATECDGNVAGVRLDCA